MLKVNLHGAGVSPSLLVRIAEQATVGVAVVAAPDWRFVLANQAYCDLVMPGRGSPVGRLMADVLPELAENAIDLFEAPLRTGNTFSRRGFPIRLDPRGPERWWDFDHIPLASPDGSPGAVLIIGREVSEHVRARQAAEQAQAALHRSEERLRFAITAAQMYCWDWDLATNKVTWSDGLEAALRMRPGSFTGTVEAFRALVHPDDRVRVEGAIRQALDGAASYDVQFRMVRADGSIRWTATRANVLRNAGGAAARMVGIDFDITAQKETEQALRRNEILLRATLDSAPIGLAVVDTNLRFVHANEQLAAINGRPRAEHAGQPLREVVGGIADTLEPIYRGVLETGVPVESLPLTGALPTAPGVQRHWLVSYHPLRGDDGTIAGVSAAVVETTALREAEEQVASAYRLVQAIMESVPDSITVRDRDDRYVFANRAAAQRFGTTAEALVGRRLADVLPPQYAARAAAYSRRVIEEDTTFTVEEPFNLDAAEQVFHTLRTPWRDAEGTVVGVITVARDISDRVASERLLTDTNADLERRVAERTRALADAAHDLAEEMRRREEAQAATLQTQKLEALGQLTGGVAHDFNNVLAALSGNLELLDRRITDERSKRLVANGRRAVERATALVRQLLSFARKQPLTPAILDLRVSVADMRDVVRHSIPPEIDCVVDVAGDTWPVMADVNQLEVALINLAVNARDAMMPRGGVIRISARNLARDEALPPELAPGDYVMIGVADTGTGMSPEVMARVLEPFFTTKGPGKGTGLGLAMVYGFAAQSGGALRLESTVGVGTTVQIILPRAKVTIAGNDAREHGPPGSARHGHADVLLVDDDALVRFVTAGLLREMGYRVTEAATAEAAYAMAVGMKNLDLVVSDLVMPGADGATLATRLRTEHPSLPILFLTGQADIGILDGETVLRKPFSRDDLELAVLRKLRRIGTEESGNDALADRLAGRIHTEALRAAYLAWRAVKGGSESLPPLAGFDANRFGLDDRMFLADVRGCRDDTTFRYLSVGRGLTTRLGRPLDGERVRAVDDALGSLTGAYLRCCRTMAPTYEFARYNLGDESPTLFERLLLPFSDDGATVSHLAGIVLLSGRSLPDVER